MKKYSLFIYMTFLLFSNIYAQQTDFVASETGNLVLKNSSKRGGIITNLLNGDIIVLRNSKKEYFIDRFNSDFDIVSSFVFDRKKEDNIQAVIEKDHGLEIVIKETIDKQEFQFKLVTYDIESNTIAERHLFRDLKKEGKNKFGLIANILGDSRHRNYFVTSPNRQFIAFIRDIVDIRTQAYEVIVYDQDFNEIYTQGYKGAVEDHYLLRDFLITDEGSVFLAGKLYKNGKKEKEKNQANYTYIVHKLTENASVDKVIEVADQYFINDVLLVQNREKIYLSGLYSEKDTEYVKGVVSYIFNNTIEDVEVQFEIFPDEVFYDVYAENRAERLISKEKELKFYHINHLLVDNLGNLYVTAEQHWTKSQYNYGTTNHYEQNHFYGNIMTIKLNEDGTLLWARNIFKKEFYSDYFPIVVNNELHVFINAGKELLRKSNGRTKVGEVGAFLGSNLYDISYYKDTGEYTFTALKENTLRTFYTLSMGEWNGKRFLSGGFWKKRGGMLSIEIDD